MTVSIDPQKFIAAPGSNVDLSAHPTRSPIFKNKAAARKYSKTQAELVAQHAHRLYANKDKALLIVLQGMDSSGKDGTTSAIFARTPPLNVRVHAFGKPTATELAQDYLWRIHEACPPRGNIAVFNRSHYEDVLVVKVRGLAPSGAIEKRYQQINDFERHLSENGTTILKFMLNMSHAVQGKRLQERIDMPRKRWKHNLGDFDDRKLWPQFMDAYQVMLKRTSTAHAPWHIIPSDSRSVRGAIITAITAQTLAGLAPEYPEITL